MAVPLLDSTQSPLWTILVPAMTSVEEYCVHLANLIDRAKPGEQYALLVDFRELSPLAGDRDTRAGVSLAMRENVDALATFVLCEARVIPNPLVRAMSTIFDWKSPVPWPTTTVATMDVAEVWLSARLEENGYPPRGKTNRAGPPQA